MSLAQRVGTIEREHLARGMQVIERMTGRRSLGWYTGRDSPNTRRLVVEHGGFAYDSDYYGDELPFWTAVTVPETIETSVP